MKICFISEVAEGSSNNKYIEIYNQQDQTDLSGYSLSSYPNGCLMKTNLIILIMLHLILEQSLQMEMFLWFVMVVQGRSYPG